MTSSPQPTSGSSTRSAYPIWGRSLRLAIDTARLGGIPIAPLFEGLPFDEHTIRTKREVAWDDYCVIVERVEELAGGPEALQDLLASSYHQVGPELRSLAGALVTPTAFVRFVCLVVDPIMFAPLYHGFEERGPNRVRITIGVRPGARPCLTMFRASIGTFRGITGHLGLPECQVTAQVSAEAGTYDMVLPKPRSRVAALGSASRALLARVAISLGYEDDGVGVVVGQAPFASDATRDERARLDAAVKLWKLTPRQAEVLALVARGKSNKEIGAALGLVEGTVELHLTSIFRKAPASSRAELISRFWSDL